MIHSLAVSFLAALAGTALSKGTCTRWWASLRPATNCFRGETWTSWGWLLNSGCSQVNAPREKGWEWEAPKKRVKKTFGVRIPSVIFLEGSFFGCWCFFCWGVFSVIDSGYLFCLHLQVTEAMDSLQVILVTTAQPTLVCGREGSVDVSLRAPHVSKAAASTGIKHTCKSVHKSCEVEACATNVKSVESTMT